jgi:hypothetical protein
MVPVMAIQNGPTQFMFNNDRPNLPQAGQASPEPAAPHRCGRLWARPAYNP